MLGPYEKFREMVREPFTMLDAGCMCGYLNHFLRQKLSNFSYLGIDRWKEALQVAREFQPGIEVEEIDLLEGDIPKFSYTAQGRAQRGYDYVWCSNIAWNGNEEAIVKRLLPLTRRACFFAQPDYTGEGILEQAKKYGDVETIQCDNVNLYVITNVHHDLFRTEDSSFLVGA
jgi:hypothetical protein